MYDIEDQHFNINRTLLLIVGLWPYQRSKLVQIQSICIFIILITAIIFQLTTFITSKCSAKLVTKVLTFTIPYCAVMIKYNSFCINRETVKLIMTQLQNIYDNLKDNNERAIIERYGKGAKRHTIVIMMIYICFLFIILIGALWPEFRSIILSVNIPKERRLPFMIEYFIDPEKYLYLLLSHMGVAAIIGIISLLATGTTLAAYCQHVCGMFDIASYRIEQWINCTSLLNEKLCYVGLICAVDIHRKAMMFSKYLISKFEISFMLLIACGVLTMSFNIFQFVQIATSEYNIGELLVHFGTASICIIYMFLLNFMGQEIMDRNNDVYTTAYKVRWYKAPLSAQRLTLFLLQRGSKPFNLRVGRLYVSCLQSFATLANASISYFTVMYSVR